VANDRIPFRVKPMLATLVAEAFDLPGWVYEEKYDGYRILAYKEGRQVRLLSRNDNDRTETFAGVAEAIARLPEPTLLLDGEVVVVDRKGVSRFQLLQRGGAHAYAVFDCLYRGGRDLRRVPLEARRAEVAAVLEAGSKDLFISRRLAKDGLAAYRVARRRGFEGLVAKDASSLYEERRSMKWLKVKVHQEDEFVIGGYTPPRGARSHLGALLLGAYEGRALRYVGKVGTGFSEKTLAELSRALAPLARKTAPFASPPREKGAVWLEPALVAQIAYQEMTAEGKLRQPVFLGIRDDKAAKRVRMPGEG